MHFCENLKEKEDIQKAYGSKPAQVLEKLFKGMHVILAHGVELEKEDIEALKDLNMYVSHCPVSNLKLGCGIAKVNEMLENNINVSLGTDGQGSGSNLDMFETMKYTALLQKGILKKPKVMSAYEVLKMATVNGAKALGLEDKIGSIRKGKRADLIILNLEDAVLEPINNLISDIVYNVKGSNVETTIVNGEILMENRKIEKVNEKEIYAKCKEIIDKIKL